MHYESDLIDEVYDVLFENMSQHNADFINRFPDAIVDRTFAQIILNDKFIIKIERI